MRGLFQGDSLSPILFCLCVAPLSHCLRQREGFQSQWQTQAVTQLMFMDDLKVYEESEDAISRHWCKGSCLGIQSQWQTRAITHSMLMDDLKAYEESEEAMIEALVQGEEVSSGCLGIWSQWQTQAVTHLMLMDDLKAYEEQWDRLRSELTRIPLHGVHRRELMKEGVDTSTIHGWLRDGRLRLTTEALVMAAQDQVIHNMVYSAKINPRCMARKRKDETVAHTLATCPQYC